MSDGMVLNAHLAALARPTNRLAASTSTSHNGHFFTA
jgi:hypothetical protein